ncbi:nitroreductase family protein [Nanoarchaeota archaeon]
MDLKKVLEKRHSCRNFKSKKVKLKDVFSVVESSIKAPSAGNLHSMRLVIVDEEEKIKKIAEVAPYNEFIGDASHLIVVCSDLTQVVRVYGSKGKGYGAQQAGAAIENMLLMIENLGLATCWVGAFNENLVRRVLSIPDKIKVEAILPIGYEFKKEPKQKKPTIKSILSYNKFGKKEW